MAARWLRIAHRGASGLAPEHTRSAFQRALALGVDMIELDVQLSRDDELVVMHDLELERTTSGQGLVRAHDLVDLKRLDAGSWFGPTFVGEPVLSLDDVLALVIGRARLNVEIKAPAADWPVLVPRLAAALRARGAFDSTVISCFEPEALQAVRVYAAHARLGLLWQHTDFSDAWRWAGELRATSIHPYWMLVSADTVRTAAEKELDVIVWTVNEPDAMRHLIDLGVGGIISDFPDRFATVASDATAL